jgi:hypothetical protein
MCFRQTARGCSQRDPGRALDEASQIELGFLLDFLNEPMVKAFAFGGVRDLTKA